MLRRHGCALLVKMALRQPRALLPMFDHLRNTVVQMRAQGQVSEVIRDIFLLKLGILLQCQCKIFPLESVTLGNGPTISNGILRNCQEYGAIILFLLQAYLISKSDVTYRTTPDQIVILLIVFH